MGSAANQAAHLAAMTGAPGAAGAPARPATTAAGTHSGGTQTPAGQLPTTTINHVEEPIRLIDASWLSVGQSLKLAQVSRRTIYNWLSAGKLRWARTAGGALRIDPSSLFNDQPATHAPLPPSRGPKVGRPNTSARVSKEPSAP